MIWFSLFKAEMKLTVPKLPAMILGIAAIIAAVVISLPPSLLTGTAAKDINIVLVSGANQTMVRMIAGMAADFDVIRRITIEEDPGAAEEGLGSGKYDVMLVIPDNIEYALFTGEAVTVTVKSNDPYLGTVVYRLAGTTVETINSVEAVTRQVYDAIRAQGSGISANNAEFLGFINRVLFEAVIRYTYIENADTPDPYDVQIVSLVLFMLSSVSSVFITVISAGQVSGGYLRRLAVRKIPAWYYLSVKILTAVCITLITVIIAGVGLIYTGININILKFIISSILLSIIISSVCLSVTAIYKHRDVSVSHSLLSCTAVLLMLLFWGGGFYPVYLMSFNIRDINPAWLSHLLADWSIAGSFPQTVSFLLFLLPFALCAGAALFRFRRSLCC